MRTLLSLVFITGLVLGTGLVGCSPVPIDAGFEGVVVRKPSIFKPLFTGGVLEDPVPPGTRWSAFSTELFQVDMRPQEFPIHLEDFMTSDGVPLDFDSVIRLRVTDSVKLIAEFGVDWFAVNVRAEFANRLRQAVRQHGMNETAIDTTAIEDIDTQVSTAMEEYIVSADLPIQLIQVTVGRANPPDAVMDQRVETARQQQRSLTEQERESAENMRAAAEAAAARADNAYRQALGLSAQEFLVIEKYEMLRDVCGQAGRDCNLIMGVDATPVIPVR